MSLITKDTLWVYVGGELDHLPIIVAYSLETAMIRLLDANTVGGSSGREHAGYPEKWACGFLDGETNDVVWTLTLQRDGGEPIELYILKCDVADDEWDSETGWRI